MNQGDNGCAVCTGAKADASVTLHRLNTPTAVLTTPEDLSEIVHGLNNVLVSILLNAQFMEWKLPSYSLMRRNTHEIQRSAKRAGVLLKRLVSHSNAGQDAASTSVSVP